jgi:hypothetical protein
MPGQKSRPKQASIHTNDHQGEQETKPVQAETLCVAHPELVEGTTTDNKLKSQDKGHADQAVADDPKVEQRAAKHPCRHKNRADDIWTDYTCIHGRREPADTMRPAWLIRNENRAFSTMSRQLSKTSRARLPVRFYGGDDQAAGGTGTDGMAEVGGNSDLRYTIYD